MRKPNQLESLECVKLAHLPLYICLRLPIVVSITFDIRKAFMMNVEIKNSPNSFITANRIAFHLKLFYFIDGCIRIQNFEDCHIAAFIHIFSYVIDWFNWIESLRFDMRIEWFRRNMESKTQSIVKNYIF